MSEYSGSKASLCANGEAPLPRQYTASEKKFVVETSYIGVDSNVKICSTACEVLVVMYVPTYIREFI